MSNPFDYRDIMKAHMRYNETRTVDEVIAEQKARMEDGNRPTGASKTPPEPGRAATKSELDAARALLGNAKPQNFAPPG